MKFIVTVKPNAKETRVERVSDADLKVWVNAPAKEGKANAAVVAAVAEFLAVPKTRVQMIKGQKAKKKIVEVAYDTSFRSAG